VWSKKWRVGAGWCLLVSRSSLEHEDDRRPARRNGKAEWLAEFWLKSNG
jgi:hypothetical protein